MPASTVNGGGGTVVKQTTVIQQSGSGGSSQAKLVAAQTALNFPSLLPGEAFLGIVSMAKSFQLLQVSATEPIEVRIYGSAISQGADSPRAPDNAPPFEVTQGLISDVIFDTEPYVWNFQNRIGCNSEENQTVNVYITVLNPSDHVAVNGGIVNVKYVAIES